MRTAADGDTVKLAERFARDAHEGQLDRAGKPYALHLERVAGHARAYGQIACAAGWLHDVLEDTPTTQAELRDRVGTPVAMTVACLTRHRDETYRNYIERIAVSGEWRAVVIKLHDIEDHALVSPEQLSPSLAARYLRALETLTPVAGNRWRSETKRVTEQTLRTIARLRADDHAEPPDLSRPAATQRHGACPRDAAPGPTAPGAA